MPLYNGTLDDYVEKNKKFDMKVFVGLFTQLLEGVANIQKNGIRHNDIHSENIFFNMNNDVPNLYIGDFGLAEINKNNDFQNDISNIAKIIVSYIYKTISDNNGLKINKIARKIKMCDLEKLLSEKGCNHFEGIIQLLNEMIQPTKPLAINEYIIRWNELKSELETKGLFSL